MQNDEWSVQLQLNSSSGAKGMVRQKLTMAGLLGCNGNFGVSWFDAAANDSSLLGFVRNDGFDWATTLGSGDLLRRIFIFSGLSEKVFSTACR